MLSRELVKPIEEEKEEDETSKMIKGIIRKNTKGTPEWKNAREELGAKFWSQKIARTNNYEIKYMDAIKKVWFEQEKDLVAQLQKGVKMNKKWNATKYISLWLAYV